MLIVAFTPLFLEKHLGFQIFSTGRGKVACTSLMENTSMFGRMPGAGNIPTPSPNADSGIRVAKPQ